MFNMHLNLMFELCMRIFICFNCFKPFENLKNTIFIVNYNELYIDLWEVKVLC